MTVEEVGPLGERVWRLPTWYRVMVIVLPLLALLPLSAVALLVSGIPGLAGAWLIIPVALATWALLIRWAWRQSATLTSDSLLIQNAFGSERVPLANITKLQFKNGMLRVTATHHLRATHAFSPDPTHGHRNPGEHFKVSAIRLGQAYWSGRYCTADAVADAIAAAAGLPPLPSRKARLSWPVAAVTLTAGIAMLVADEALILHPGSRYWFLSPVFMGFAPATIGISLASIGDRLFHGSQRDAKRARDLRERPRA